MTARTIEAQFEGLHRGFSRVISREPYAEVLPYQAGGETPEVRNSADPALVRNTKNYQGDGRARYVVTTYTRKDETIPDHQSLIGEALEALPAERERQFVSAEARVTAIRLKL